MTNVVIRQYEPSDLKACRSLWAELTEHHRELYEDPSIGGDNPRLHFDKHLARIGPEHTWVAEAAGEVVGMAGLIVGDPDAELEPIVVSSRWRNEGIGRSLLNRVIEEANKLNLRYLSVKPVARNTNAISFFHDAALRLLGQVELFMDLRQPPTTKWRSGPELFGRRWEY